MPTSMSIYHKFILVIALLGISVIANAGERGHEGGWRLGLGHDRYGIYHWEGRGWHRMPGSATDVGDGWVIGTDRRHGGYGIYRWNGRDWNRVPGGAIRIGGSYEQPWVINNQGEKYFWNGYDWYQARGGHRRNARVIQGRTFKNESYRREGYRNNRKHNRRSRW